MAKSMARINGNSIVSLEWHNDASNETDTLKDPGDRSVGIGDTYDSGKWYRDGVEILTKLEEALARIALLEAENADKTAALDAIYTGVIE